MDATSLFTDVSFLFSIFAIASVAGMISERSGVVNIAIEGYMIIGALVFSISGTYMSEASNFSQIFSMLIAMVVCGLFSLLQSLSSIKLKSDQIIAGTAINVLAQGIGLYLATSGIFGNGTQIDSGFTSLKFGGNTIFTFYLVLAVIILAVVGIYFTFTKIGKWHIAAGENPNALDAVGISVIKFRWGAATVSGALAGLAGCIFVIYQRNNFGGSTSGYGFLALAIMIVGQWRTSYITAASFVFSLFFAIAKELPHPQTMNSSYEWFKTNADLVSTFPFIISLLVMVGASKWSKVPKADGIPFDKAKR
jgi:ABC-type uncharacterized transport system permease subunit